MPNQTTRGIPAWMFDEAVCARVQTADQPIIDGNALLRLAQLLDRQCQSGGIGEHESTTTLHSNSAATHTLLPAVAAAGGLAPKPTDAKRGSGKVSGVVHRTAPRRRAQEQPSKRGLP